MSLRSPIRFSIWVITFALLGFCLLLVFHRPLPRAAAPPKLATNSNSVENTVPTNHSPAKANLSNEATAQPVASAPQQNLQADELYRALQDSIDPQEKRQLRKQLASIQPSGVPFRFALEKYSGASNEEEKLHLQSIVSQIDASEIESEVAGVASKTTDEAFFVSLAYALRNSKTALAKQQLLNLAANNQLPSTRPNSLMSNQGLVALHRCLLDTLQASDLDWITDYAATKQTNAVQARIISDFKIGRQ